MKRGICLFFLLTACAPRTVYRPAPVDIPVAQACVTALPSTPRWPTLSLPPDAGLFEQTRATLAELELRKGYEAQLEAALKACR